VTTAHGHSQLSNIIGQDCISSG